METSIIIFIAMFLSYVIGSLCSAVIVCHLCHLPDPRSEGSRNPGTTNVLRIAGKKYAIIVLLADLLKGLLPILAMQWTDLPLVYSGCVGLAAVLGHIFPIFFKFKGGKGVATTLGVLFGLNWLLGLLAILTWLAVAAITRYSSLAAIIALVVSPLYLWLIEPIRGPVIIPMSVIVVCVLYQHRENIQRLWRGEESKIKLK